MATFLLFENLGYVEEDSAFLDIAELGVYGCSEHSHGRGEAHVCVDKGRNVAAVLSDEMMEDLVVFPEGRSLEEFLDFGSERVAFERYERGDEIIGIRKMTMEESEQKIAAVTAV